MIQKKILHSKVKCIGPPQKKKIFLIPQERHLWYDFGYFFKKSAKSHHKWRSCGIKKTFFLRRPYTLSNVFPGPPIGGTARGGVQGRGCENPSPGKLRGMVKNWKNFLLLFPNRFLKMMTSSSRNKWPFFRWSKNFFQKVVSFPLKFQPFHFLRFFKSKVIFNEMNTWFIIRKYHFPCVFNDLSFIFLKIFVFHLFCNYIFSIRISKEKQSYRHDIVPNCAQNVQG